MDSFDNASLGFAIVHSYSVGLRINIIRAYILLLILFSLYNNLCRSFNWT